VSNTPTPTGVTSDPDKNYAKLERIALDQAMGLEKLEDRARAAELLKNLVRQETAHGDLDQMGCRLRLFHSLFYFAPAVKLAVGAVSRAQFCSL
jgi:hypothetical protein